MRRLLCVMAAALMLPLSAAAGNGDDFGTWTAVNLTGSLSDRLKTQLWFEMRTKDDISAIDCFDILPSITYSALPFLDFGIGAEFVDAQVRRSIGFRPFVTLHLSSGPLSVSIREMPFIEIYNDGTAASYTLRSSLKATYTIPSTRITPYMNIELFNKRHWDKTRHYAGIDFGLGTHSSIDLFYMYYSFAGKDWQRHLLGVTYNLKLF